MFAELTKLYTKENKHLSSSCLGDQLLFFVINPISTNWQIMVIRAHLAWDPGHTTLTILTLVIMGQLLRHHLTMVKDDSNINPYLYWTCYFCAKRALNYYTRIRLPHVMSCFSDIKLKSGYPSIKRYYTL